MPLPRHQPAHGGVRAPHGPYRLVCGCQVGTFHRHAGDAVQIGAENDTVDISEQAL